MALARRGLQAAMSATFTALARNDSLRTQTTPGTQSNASCGTRLYPAGCVGYGPEGQGFQIFGFDVLLDAEGTPTLLEVNGSPSMCIDAVHTRAAEKRGKKRPGGIVFSQNDGRGGPEQSRRRDSATSGGICGCIAEFIDTDNVDESCAVVYGLA